MLISLSIRNVITRVRSAWNASAIKSNISFKCESKSFGTPIGASGISSVAEVLLGAHLHAPLDLAHGVEIVVDHVAVAAPELRCKLAAWLVTRSRMLPVSRDDRLALLLGIALPEQPIEDRARVVLHRQRLRRRAERDRAAADAPW